MSNSIPDPISEDEFFLPEGNERLNAQRASYIAHLVSNEQVSPRLLEKSERLKNAEALFVGKAFDEIAAAISASSLDDNAQEYLREQFLAFPPSYRIADVDRNDAETQSSETIPRQVEIEVNPALKAAAQDDTELLKSILLADSRARIVSAEIHSRRSSLSPQAGDMVLIHALIKKGTGVNNEQIDFSVDPFVIPIKVDDTSFAVEEKAQFENASTTLEAQKVEVGKMRENAQNKLDALNSAAQTLETEAIRNWETAKQAAIGAVLGRRTELATQRVEAENALEELVTAAKKVLSDNLPEHADIRSSEAVRSALEATPFVGWQFDYAMRTLTSPLNANGIVPPWVKGFMRVGSELLSGIEEHQVSLKSISTEKNALDNLEYAIQGDRKRIEWRDDNGNIVSHTTYKPDTTRADGFSKAVAHFFQAVPDGTKSDLTQKVEEVQAALESKDASSQAASSIARNVKQLLPIVQGNRERMRWWDGGREVYNSSSKPDISGADGFDEARKRPLRNLKAENISGVEEAVQAINALSSALSSQDEATKGEQQAHKALSRKRYNLRRTVYLNVIREGIDMVTFQALQLLRELHHESLREGERAGNYQSQAAFGFNPANSGVVEFSMTDFGCYFDANGDLQRRGVDPSQASNLREELSRHLDDYDIDDPRPPLAVSEVLSAARAAIAAARGKTRQEREESGKLRGDYDDLGFEALQLAGQEETNYAKLARALSSNQGLQDEASAAARAHKFAIEGYEETETSLRTEKADALARANEAEARTTSLLATTQALRAALDVANRRMFGSNKARQSAWDEFDTACSRIPGLPNGEEEGDSGLPNEEEEGDVE